MQKQPFKQILSAEHNPVSKYMDPHKHL